MDFDKKKGPFGPFDTRAFAAGFSQSVGALFYKFDALGLHGRFTSLMRERIICGQAPVNGGV